MKKLADSPDKVLINTEKKYIPYVLRYFIVESYTMDVLE